MTSCNCFSDTKHSVSYNQRWYFTTQESYHNYLRSAAEIQPFCEECELARVQLASAAPRCVEPGSALLPDKPAFLFFVFFATALCVDTRLESLKWMRREFSYSHILFLQEGLGLGLQLFTKETTALVQLLLQQTLSVWHGHYEQATTFRVGDQTWLHSYTLLISCITTVYTTTKGQHKMKSMMFASMTSLKPASSLFRLISTAYWIFCILNCAEHSIQII